MKEKTILKCTDCGIENKKNDFIMIYKSSAEKFLGISPTVPYCKKCYERKNND